MRPLSGMTEWETILTMGPKARDHIANTAIHIESQDMSLVVNGDDHAWLPLKL